MLKSVNNVKSLEQCLFHSKGYINVFTNIIYLIYFKVVKEHFTYNNVLYVINNKFISQFHRENEP